MYEKRKIWKTLSEAIAWCSYVTYKETSNIFSGIRGEWLSLCSGHQKRCWLPELRLKGRALKIGSNVKPQILKLFFLCALAPVKKYNLWWLMSRYCLWCSNLNASVWSQEKIYVDGPSDLIGLATFRNTSYMFNGFHQFKKERNLCYCSPCSQWCESPEDPRVWRYSAVIWYDKAAIFLGLPHSVSVPTVTT